MHNYNLKFIGDEDIYNHVKETVALYRTQMNLIDFNKNIVDPIKLTFDAKIYGKTLKEIVVSECLRQMDKANNNHIGYFHQNLFKYAIDGGWSVPKEGFDVVNEKKHVFVEMKNKHNTMNSASSQKTYMKMQQKIVRDDKATCYLVEVIAKKSQDKAWIVTVDKERFCNEHIRRISMDKFYELVFGDSEAFCKMCKALPHILDEVMADKEIVAEKGKKKNSGNTVFKELEAISPDITKSLYLLAFQSYEGFELF